MTGDALCFDMYGTLCDTSSVTETLAVELSVPDAAVASVDERWRRKQLQYAYQVSLMDAYEPFWSVTGHALDYALAAHDLAVDDATRDRILESYEHLEPFPEAVETLERLAKAGHVVTVLSNGNPEMLATLAENAGLDDHLSEIISADEVRTFKPSPAVYENAARRLDRRSLRVDSFPRTPGTLRARRPPGWRLRGSTAPRCHSRLSEVVLLPSYPHSANSDK